MKPVILFPGYGSQYVGMVKELYDESRLVQEYFEEASNCLNINFVKLCFASSEAELRKIDSGYLSLFIASSSIAAVLMEQGIEPSAITGYQTGQYGAVFASGGLSMPDGLYFLSKYAQYYQEFLDQSGDFRALLIEGIACKDVDDIITQCGYNNIAISTYKSQLECIVVGAIKSMDIFEKKLQKYSVKLTETSVHAGLYSKLANPVLERLKVYLEKIDFKDTKLPCISSLSGLYIQSAQEIKQVLVDGIVQAVRWDRVIDALKTSELVVEVGPGGTLTKWLKNIYPEKNVIAVNKPADILLVQKIISEQTS